MSVASSALYGAWWRNHVHVTFDTWHNIDRRRQYSSRNRLFPENKIVALYLWQRIKALVKSLLHSTFEDFKKKELYIKASRCTCISIFLYQQRRPIQKKTFALIIRPNLSYILNVFLFYKSLVPQNAIYCYIKCKNKILLTSIRACVRSLVRKDIKEQVLLIIHGRQVCSPSFFDKKHG